MQDIVVREKGCKWVFFLGGSDTRRRRLEVLACGDVAGEEVEKLPSKGEMHREMGMVDKRDKTKRWFKLVGCV